MTTNSSFYIDGGTYSEVNDGLGNVPDTDLTPNPAESSFYQNGQDYVQADPTLASASATEAAASAAAALASKLAAAASAAAALVSEGNADTSEAAALASQTSASSSATSASGSASTATTQASTATTQATNAAASATAASNSATSASTSATTATTLASNASTSATNAATSATNAATSATSAATSATAAATSETNAAASVQAKAGTLAPLMDATATVGVSTFWSREDHKHPTDTTLAPKASPALTGTPTAPTAAALTNTTQVATTAFVDDARVVLVAADALKAPLASPTFTGVPAAPTAALATNTTQLATTAFVIANATGAGAVRYDTAQGLTSAQKAQGRANIDALKKNYILNGAMMVSQENGTTAGTASQYHPVDQFRLVHSMGGVISVAQVASATPAGSPNRLRATVTTADAAVAAGDLVYVGTHIEGLRVADLLFGTASAKVITIQFGVKAPAGTYCVSIANGASNRAYVAEYVISGGEANTDVVKSVTLTGDTSGTWLKDTGLGCGIAWGLMAGTTYQTTVNTWAAGSFTGTSSQFNFMGTISNVFELFDVSLTEGTVAPAFQVPDYISELAVCRRYWESTFLIGTQPASAVSTGSPLAGMATSAAAYQNMLSQFWRVGKRVAPTLTFYNPYVAGSGFSNSGTGDYTAAAYTNGPESAAIRCEVAVAVNGNLSIQLKASARL